MTDCQTFWENCDRWDWMFELLDDRILEFSTHNYHNAERVEEQIEGLEKYIDSSFGMVNESSDQEREQVRFRNFGYKQAAQHLRQEIDTEKLSQLEGSRRLFRNVRFAALKAVNISCSMNLADFTFISCVTILPVMKHFPVIVTNMNLNSQS